MPGIELAGATLTAIDFETTGSVPGWPNEPWQIGLYEFTLPSSPDGQTPSLDGQTAFGQRGLGRGAPAARGGAEDPPRLFSSLLRVAPDRPFNRYAPGRHALLRHEIAAAPSLPELWEELAPRLRGRPLVAHNAGTERTILRAAAPLDRLGPWIATLSLARTILPGRTSYALEDLAPSLGLMPTVAALAPSLAPHDALYDAVACGELLRLFFTNGLSFCPTT
jgi:DNA polymerase III epsilon subunit-like protein